MTFKAWNATIQLISDFVFVRAVISNQKCFIISEEYHRKLVAVQRSGDTKAQVQLFLTEKHLSIWQMSTFPVRNARKVVVDSENSDF